MSHYEYFSKICLSKAFFMTFFLHFLSIKVSQDENMPNIDSKPTNLICFSCPIYSREGGGKSPSLYVTFFFVLFRVGREGVKGK